MEARRSVEDKGNIGNDKKWVPVMLCQLNQKTEQNKTEMQSETDQKGEKWTRRNKKLSKVYEKFYNSILSPETSAQPLNNKWIADCQTSVGRYFGVFLTLLKSGKVFTQVLHCISTEGLAAHQACVCSLTADNNAEQSTPEILFCFCATVGQEIENNFITLDF